jgi:hypothetical protein
MLRDARSGGLLRLSYRGKIAMGGEAGRVLRGEEGAGTTQFGESCELCFSLSLFFFLFLVVVLVVLVEGLC